jgi:hypothetical protein
MNLEEIRDASHSANMVLKSCPELDLVRGAGDAASVLPGATKS